MWEMLTEWESWVYLGKLVLSLVIIVFVRAVWTGQVGVHTFTNFFSGTSGGYADDGNYGDRRAYYDTDDNFDYGNSSDPHGLNENGEIYRNHHLDEPLDLTNPHHYPIIDSYDSNIDEDNPTKPW